MNILSESLASGTIPSDFKSAVVRPLFNKPSLDPNELKNYRSIRIYHFRQNSSRSLRVYSLQSGHSTVAILLRILNDAFTSYDDDKISFLSPLDLSAAFYTIDHEVLLCLPEQHFGICGTALNWFCSFLSDRKQYVLVDGQKLT